MMQPGIYTDMSNEDYHAQTDWLSSTQLKKALPERYSSGGNEAAFAFGTLFHEVCLEPHLLDKYAVVDPHQIAGNNPKTGKPYDSPTMTAKYKAHVAEQEEAGRIIVSQEDWDRAHAMRDSIKAHPLASDLVFGDGGSNEESVFVIDENGIQLKSRFDRRKSGILLDLKSTKSKPGACALRRTMYDFGYHVSGALYSRVAELAGLDAAAFALVFVTKAEPYYVTVAEIGEEALAEGDAQVDLAIARMTDPGVEPYEGATGFITL